MVPIADYVDILGLHCDPFEIDPPLLWSGLEAFGASVIHELEFVSPVVWVYGPRGSGKSALAGQLGGQLKTNAEVLCFDVTQGVGPEQIVEQLNELLLLPTGQGELFAPAAQLFHSDESVGPIVLVVDNIDHWPVSQLAQWLNGLQRAKLLAASKLRLLLLASHSPELVPLDESVSVQTLAIPSPDLEQAVDWLNALMTRAGAREAVLTSKIVAPWWREADGNLNRLIERARVFLLESSELYQKTPSAAGDDKGVSAASGRVTRRPLPAAHIMTAAALLAGLAVVYLYAPEQEAPREQVILLPADRASSSVVTEASSPPAEVTPRVSVSSSVASSAGQPPVAEPEAPAEGAGEVLSGGASSVAREPAPPPGGYSQIRPPASSYTEDELEILSWRADYYTLQVLGVSQKTAAEDYIARQSNRAILRLYRTSRKNKPWFVVVAGVFPNRAAAEAAKKDLPANQLRAQPWLRQVQALHKELGL